MIEYGNKKKKQKIKEQNI